MTAKGIVHDTKRALVRMSPEMVHCLGCFILAFVNYRCSSGVCVSLRFHIVLFEVGLFPAQEDPTSVRQHAGMAMSLICLCHSATQELKTVIFDASVRSLSYLDALACLTFVFVVCSCM